MRASRIRAAGLAVALVCLASCSSKSAFKCAGSEQCVLGGMQGVCEPQGYCSFADSSCPGGRKFEPNAGDLAGTCVEVDAGMTACGEGGQACCASGSACGPGLSCIAGSCGSCIADVSAGRHSMCVLHSDHTVWCAGENQFGQLGFGLSGANSATWMQVRDSTSVVISDATAISGGWEFSCALRAGGTVWCWGIGGTGTLGNNTTNSSPFAVQVQKTNGQPLTNIVQLASGKNHTCTRDATGGVWCWGRNDFGQIGDGTITTMTTNNNRAGAVAVLNAPAGAALTGALDLQVGGEHSCVTKANDAAWCWGRNSKGQLGDNTTTNRPNPVSYGTALKLVAGNFITCALHADGGMYCTGDTWHNRIGNGAPAYDTVDHYATPERVLTSPGGAGLTGISSLAAGGVTCAVMTDTSVVCWGDNIHGQTGNGGGSTVPAPVLRNDGKALTGVDRLVTKFPRVCAHRTDGSWWCWGRNLEGAFGDGTFVNHGLATPLQGGCP